MEPAENDPRAVADRFAQLLALSGRPLEAGAKVLDFGCGHGTLVEALLASRLDTYGCDFPAELGSMNRLRAIEEPYRLPFADRTFDCVISTSVFEHVQDYQLAFREIRRVLRPGAASLHLFPPRYWLREPHTFVPLATMIRGMPWLRLWARLGVRNQFQHGMSSHEVAELNRRFLVDHTT